MKHRWWGRSGTVAGVLVAMAAATGCGGEDQEPRAAAVTATTEVLTTTTTEAAAQPTAGRVGDALQLQERYELNGQPTIVDLRVRVVKVDADAKAPDEFTGPEEGMRWVRLRIKFTNQSKDALQQSVEDISVVTGSDEEFPVQGYPFRPSLGHNVAQLGPGQSRVGFVAAQVPRGVALKEVRMTGAYVDPLVWTLGG